MAAIRAVAAGGDESVNRDRWIPTGAFTISNHVSGAD
jgi:hypothetical protein